ncbi:Glomulin [Holothuria leucospilota]|uniref:Glomulin n=1 Tax=Holothuria leucospilota TaxID=206669 RepID=A0A9Q1C6W5_HOLLE|nr:Glomulin [Holothuria leucospilota]
MIGFEMISTKVWGGESLGERDRLGWRKVLRSLPYIPQWVRNLSNTWFVAGHLRQIYTAIFHLPQGSQTDLLEESDKIIASLNFLRYLLLRDPKDVDATGIWSVLEQTDKGYLSELITGLELSRIHYKQRADDLLDEKKRAKKAKDAETLSVSVGGQEIGKMPFEQQMQVLTSAQFTFDLMQSLLGRVNEIISAEARG